MDFAGLRVSPRPSVRYNEAPLMKPLACRVALLVVAAPALLAFAPAGTQRYRLHVDGRARTYLAHAPPATREHTLLPVVIVLHGHGGTASKAMRISGMNRKADAEGFLAVYPNGSSWAGMPWRSWNAGSCCGYAESKGIDDVAFLRALIADLRQAFPVDPARIYVTGMSNGGMMAYRAACELSDLVAAIAPVAGALSAPSCAPAHPVSVLIIHGTNDQYVPYEGGRSSVTHDTRVDPPVMETAEFWARQNCCAGSLQQHVRGRIAHAWFPDCAQGAAVEVYTVQTGGHAWPGGRRGWLFGDGPTRELSATDVMWEFFARHAKPAK